MASQLRTATLLALLAGASLAGCASTAGQQRTPAAPPVTSYEMEPMKIEAVKGATGLEVQAFDAAELFESAGKAYGEGRWDDAARDYDKLLRSFPDSQYAKASLYNVGLVFQGKSDWKEAASRFRAFLQKYPEGNDAKDALFQLGATLAEATDWTGSRDTFVRVLERQDLSADDRVEAIARKGFAILNLGQLDEAEATFRQVFALKQRLEATAEERLQTDYYLAFSQYQVAQISHKKSNAVPLRWPESQMNADLEEKAKLLLQARRQYIDAVRYGNPRIASMAAFQIGTLFQEFYETLLAVTPPKELVGDEKKLEREVYQEELRKKLRVVLEKALRGHEHNIELFERLGVETEWVTRSRTAIAKLKELLEPETSFNFADPKAPPRPPAPEVSPARPEEPRPQQRPDGERAPEPSTNVKRQIL